LLIGVTKIIAEMKKIILLLILTLGVPNLNAQSCDKLIKTVKTKSTGTTYTSYESKVISKVTFYSVNVDYKTHYFAIVCFKKEYSYSCNEYIYQVASNTKLNYSFDYNDSAGKAFWKHIQPYSNILNCSPNFD
jgi:hypothetical protein